MASGLITFKDVVIEFFLHKWEFLDPLQKKLCRDVIDDGEL